jgi:hypothetical protein
MDLIARFQDILILSVNWASAADNWTKSDAMGLDLW